MFNFNKPFGDIGQADVEKLLTDQTLEDRGLDYKQELPDPDRGGRNDFLTDVSAFANTDGGWLLYGIEEKVKDEKKTGVPDRIDGVPGINADEAKSRLEQWIRDGLDPRVEGVRIKPVTGFAKGPVLLVRVPKSWNGPHMITGSPRFYRRNDGGNLPLNCAQIRSSFLQSEQLSDRIRRFQADRIGKIVANETPLALSSPHRVVLHLIPLSSMAPGASMDLELAQKDAGNIAPLGSTGFDGKHYNFDGFVTWNFTHSYLQLFRNGIIESVDASMLSGQELIPTTIFEPQTISAVNRYLKIFSSVSMPPPVVLLLTLIAVKGYVTETSQQGALRQMLGMPKNVIDRNILALPDLLIEDLSTPAETILRPAFDMIWQACGYKTCPNYDQATGKWKALQLW